MSSHRKFLASVDDELAGIRFKAEGAMKHCRLISLAAMLCTAVLMPSSVSSAMERIDIDLTQWTPPDIATSARFGSNLVKNAEICQQHRGR